MSTFRNRSESFSGEPARPEGSHRDSNDERNEKSQAQEDEYSSYVKERQERRREEALRHLIESGRANSPEEAEHYLERVNRIQEKLVLFVRGFQSDSEVQETLQTLPGTFFQYPNIGVETLHNRLRKLTETDLAKLSSDNIDKAHPRLWSLKRSFDSFEDSSAFIVDTLAIEVAQVGRVLIYPDVHGGTETIKRLQKYLSNQDLQFLEQEYRYALQDIEQQLRAATDQIVDQRNAQELSDDWQILSESE